MNAVDLSGDAGLIAVVLLTGNILLGLLISVRYNTRKRFPHRSINIFKIHNWTGYVALGVVLLHPTLLLFSATAGFRVWDLAFPVRSPSQPFENTLGAIALYTLAFVVVTSYYRVRIGRRLWKRLHYFAYAAAPLFFIHGLLTDPRLKNSPFDPFDGEKVLIEFCLLLVLLGIILRVRYALRKTKEQKIFA